MDFYLFNNHKTPILPAYSKPFPDELLTSWLVRLAHDHYLKVQTFSHLVFPGINIWNRDIDRSAPNPLLTKLSQITNSSFQTVKNTTLSNYDGILYEKYNSKTFGKWEIPLGVYHRSRRRFGQQFCPMCFQKEKTVYYRKQWRLSLSFICDKCGCFLLDNCANCGAPISFFRREMGLRNRMPIGKLSYCYRCDFNLADSIIKPASSNLVDCQKSIFKYFDEKHNNTQIYPFQYFDVLYYWVHFFTSGREHYKEFQKLVCDKLNLEFHENDKGGYKSSFFFKRVQERSEAIYKAFWLLEDWPDKFIELVSEIKLNSSVYLLRDFKNPPFWYYSVVYENFFYSNVNRHFMR